MVVPLDYLNENGWAVLDWLGKYLQKISIVIVVDQNLELLYLIQVFLHLNRF